MKLKEEDVPGAILPRNQNMKSKQPQRKRRSYKNNYARTAKFLKLFVHKKKTTTTTFFFKVAAGFDPPNNPIYERCLVWVPGMQPTLTLHCCKQAQNLKI